MGAHIRSQRRADTDTHKHYVERIFISKLLLFFCSFISIFCCSSCCIVLTDINLNVLKIKRGAISLPFRCCCC